MGAVLDGGAAKAKAKITSTRAFITYGQIMAKHCVHVHHPERFPTTFSDESCRSISVEIYGRLDGDPRSPKDLLKKKGRRPSGDTQGDSIVARYRLTTVARSERATNLQVDRLGHTRYVAVTEADIHYATMFAPGGNDRVLAWSIGDDVGGRGRAIHAAEIRLGYMVVASRRIARYRPAIRVGCRVLRLILIPAAHGDEVVGVLSRAEVLANAIGSIGVSYGIRG